MSGRGEDSRAHIWRLSSFVREKEKIAGHISGVLSSLVRERRG